jgi:hypothetical protein
VWRRRRDLGGRAGASSADGSARDGASGGDATLGVDASTDDASTDDASTDDASTDAEAVDAGPGVLAVANIAFGTYHGTPSSVGGLDGGDALCNAEAADAGLPGTYVAYLSTSAVDAIDRIGGSRGWVRPDGRPFVDRPEDLA